MRQLASALVASVIVACAPSAPVTYTSMVDRPVEEVRSALSEMSDDALNSTLQLPPVTAGLSPDGQVVWNLYVGDNLAGQLQIKLAAQGAGKTAVSAIYAPATLRAADMVVPALRNPKTLADLLIKALDARVTALDPQNPPHVVKRNNALADDQIKAARIAANPTAIPDGVQQAFEETSKQLQDGASVIELPEATESGLSAQNVAGAEAGSDSDRPAPKFGEPMLDPNKDR